MRISEIRNKATGESIAEISTLEGENHREAVAAWLRANPGHYAVLRSGFKTFSADPPKPSGKVRVGVSAPEDVEVERTRPTKPGFYWALWLKASEGTHEGHELAPSNDWEVVEVWENRLGDPCEADGDEKFGVSVPGVRETQWPDNFKWGFGPIEQP